MQKSTGTETESTRWSRRALLAAGAALGSTLVAGCTSGDQSSESSGQSGGGDGQSSDGGDGGDESGGGGNTDSMNDSQTEDRTADGEQMDDGSGGTEMADESAMTTESGAMTEASGDATATPTQGSGGESPAWQSIELNDVLTGETFTIGQFDTPVILETFAVWCPKCTAQQDKLTEMKAEMGEDVTIVSLNIDPNEDAKKVKQHASEKGYDWRYAISPTELTSALVDEFGQVMTSAPAVPIVIVCPDGSASRMEQRGVKSIDTIKSALGNC